MATHDIRLRYRRSLLGPFWLSITMAAQVLGIGLLFSQIMDLPIDTFLMYIGASLLIWGLIAGLIGDGCNVLIDSAGHLRAVPIPTPVLAAQVIQRQLIVFLHNAVVVVVMMAFFGLRPTVALMALPLGVLIVLAFGYFMAVAFGPICLRFRDLAQVVGSVLQVAFFVTPVIWLRGQGRLSDVFVDANPLYHLIEVVRAPLLGQWPTALNWIVAGGVLGCTIVLAFISLSVSRRKIYMWL
jgi:lipopolysaccharide transport system permease protein